MGTKEEKKKSDGPSFGIGLDVGTMNLVSARRSDKKIVTKRMRDVFLDLPPSAKNMLSISNNTSFVERDDEIFILGDAALEVANVFGREARRPLSQGLISPNEMDSLEVLALLVQEVLESPLCEDEICCFSIPAAPVDDPSRDVIYHEGVFSGIIQKCGFDPIASNEAMAIIFAEAAPDFSGLAMSWGSGMVNVALALNTLEVLSFSVSRSGDWIDQGVAKSLNITQARVCAIKEAGIDLINPQGREQEALSFYYKNLMDYVLKYFVAEFKKIQHTIVLPQAIPLIISGGTSKPKGFLELFQQRFNRVNRRLGLDISEIRMASDPLNAVAHGMLVQAVQEYS